MGRDDIESLRDEHMRPVLEDLRAAIREAGAGEIAGRAGVGYVDRGDRGQFVVPLFGEEFTVDYPGLDVRGPDGGEAGRFERGVLLYYLRGMGGGQGGDEWVSLRELPGGRFYAAAFQGYSGDVLARELGGDAGAVDGAAATLGGTPEPMGDAGYSFQVLPGVRLAVAVWRGDEEFSPRASVLFNRSSARHLPTDVMAVLGSRLVARLLGAARGEVRGE